MLKIQPLAGIIQIDIPQANAGILDTSMRSSAVEFAEVIAVGDGYNLIKKGDKIFFKAWAVDIVDHQDKKYYFINVKTDGILAVVK